jgi:microcystin-dependent protein
MTSTLRISSANTARTKPTTGDTKMSFVNTDHLGWLKCDGREMDKTADNLLFQVIGYTFGGSGNVFNLPNPAGRVMGTVGTVTDANTPAIVRTYAKGDSVGELDHKLTIGEMPAHNHNKATPSPGANTTADGTTSENGGHNHTLTDLGHAHNFNAQNDDFNNSSSYGALTNPTDHTISAANFDAGNVRAWTDPVQLNTTGITIAAVTDHSHTISSNGGDQYHNNVQPTLFYGNTFIYCGVPMRGEFPFKTGLAPVLI